jgi:hypothetical protein
MIILPDHLHCTWTPPSEDADFLRRRHDIKAQFAVSKGGMRFAFPPYGPTKRFKGAPPAVAPNLPDAAPRGGAEMGGLPPPFYRKKSPTRLQIQPEAGRVDRGELPKVAQGNLPDMKEI